MKRYKLIREYPGSPKLGTIRQYNGNVWSDSNEFINPVINPENYPEFWELVVEKDYEILSYKNPYNNLVYKFQNSYNSYISEDNLHIITKNYCELYNKIHSVKRLSDGKIFTIGDEINSVTWTLKHKNDKIKSIFIATKEHFKDFGFKIGSIVLITNITWQTTLKNAIKIEQPLFTTEDGVDIFKGDKAYIVWPVGMYMNSDRSNIFAIKPVHNGIMFYSKEKAEEYILMNKPCLSYKDVENIITTSSKMRLQLLEKIKEKIKEKLN